MYASSDAKSTTAPLITWIREMGDVNVLSINIYIGQWDITSPYQCYVADFTVNGNNVDLSNAARIRGSMSDLPNGF